MKRYDLAEVLERVSYAVFGVFDIQELQERVVDLCQDIFDAEACSLFLVDERCEELIMVAARGYSAQFLGRSAPLVRSDQVVEHPSKPEDKLGITGWIASTGHSFMSNTPEEHRVHPHWTGKYDIQQFGPNKRVHNFYGVPLKVAENDIIGVLKVEGKREGGKYRSFSETDTNLFNILSAYITLAISGAWRVEEIRRQREQLQTTTDALHKVVASLSEELPMQYLLDEIVATTAEVLSAEACVLFLVDPADSSRLIETAGKGYAEHLIGKAEYKLVPKRKLVEQPERYEDRVGLTAWIAITGQPFLARDNDELRKHPHWRGQYDKEHYPEGSGKKCESFLGVPLRVSDRVVGVLKVENKQVDEQYVPFTDQDRQVFETLARSIAIAIGTVQEQRVKRERAVTDAMYRVSQALAGRFELEPLLNEIVKAGTEIFSAEACVVYLVDPADSSRLIETAGKGYAEHLIGKAEYKLVPKRKLVEQPERYEDRVGLTAWIAITGQPFLARDNDELRKHPHWRGQYDKEHYPEGSGKKCESFLGLPLRVGNEVLGVLKVENKNIGGRYVPFDEREQHIFQLLANSAAIAIHNARELQKFQEARELAAIGQSATAMAHSMRTPLQDIRLTAELLEEKLQKIPSVPKLSLQNVRDIILRVDQMDGAIKRVREAAQQLKPELKFHDIGDILCSSFTQNPSFAQQFRKLKIKAEIVGLEQIRDRSIKCDRHLLEEAIGNLVANASEAVSDGGRVSIHIKETNGDLCIEVQDSGPGIDENLLPLTSLFEPFRSTKKGGLGLGLVIVRRNVGAHGGNVSYERTSHSTCFRIEIPRKGQRED
jgi:GAF domain-containing protein/anti-sigma regulatory factor (Ser/Thr protein kinase)